MTPAELGREARRLPEAARLALREWPEGRPWLGAVLRGSRQVGFRVGERLLPLRAARALIRAGLAEERILWLCMTERGEAVAGWLGRPA